MEEWLIYKEFQFEAAHQLPHHDGKCRRLHGHSWVCRVYLQGNKLIEDGPKQGMLLDFEDLRTYFKPLLRDFLDHHNLNETTGLLNPTSEALAKWVFEKLEESSLPGLYSVEIRETCTSGAQYTKIKGGK